MTRTLRKARVRWTMDERWKAFCVSKHGDNCLFGFPGKARTAAEERDLRRRLRIAFMAGMEAGRDHFVEFLCEQLDKAIETPLKDMGER